MKEFRNLAKGDKVALYVTEGYESNSREIRFTAPGMMVIATVTRRTSAGYVSMRVPGRRTVFTTLTAGDMLVEEMN